MIKHFRAWDGKEYWYANDDWLFINDFKALELRLCTFDISAVDMFIGKLDVKGQKIFENDLIKNISQDNGKLYQVVWSTDDCGFRKVPYGMPLPETKIDGAFAEVVGTIYSNKK